MLKFRSLKYTATSLLLAMVMTIGVVGRGLAAPNYSCGAYGGGGYNQNCPNTSSSSGSGSSSTTTDPAAPEGSILLNEFIEYLDTTGKKLDLSVEQIIYFNVEVNGSVEQHSVLIKEMGANFVIVTFASTPKDVRLFVGETTKQDVTDDNQADIEAALDSVNNGIASMTFKQLVPAVAKTTTKKTAPTYKKSSSLNYLIIIVSVLFGLFVLWLLLSRRHKNQQPGPN